MLFLIWIILKELNFQQDLALRNVIQADTNLNISVQYSVNNLWICCLYIESFFFFAPDLWMERIRG